MNQQNLALQQGPLQAAKNQQIQAIQSSLSDDTLNLIKMFGASSAMSGASINAPFASTVGGFATPFLTPGGGLVGARG